MALVNKPESRPPDLHYLGPASYGHGFKFKATRMPVIIMVSVHGAVPLTEVNPACNDSLRSRKNQALSEPVSLVPVAILIDRRDRRDRFDRRDRHDRRV